MSQFDSEYPSQTKGTVMRIVIYILMTLCLLLLLLGYSLLVIAGEADERAEKMYREWKESKNERGLDKEV